MKSHGCRYRKGAKSEPTGRVEAILAERSTDEGGEVRPKRPAGGKVKPGKTLVAVKHRRDIEFANCVNDPVTDCRAIGEQSGNGVHHAGPPHDGGVLGGGIFSCTARCGSRS